MGLRVTHSPRRPASVLFTFLLVLFMVPFGISDWFLLYGPSPICTDLIAVVCRNEAFLTG